MNWYQKPSDSRTILLFGEGVPGQIRHTERVLYDAEAYEAAQGYRYLKEVINLRESGKKALGMEFLCVAQMLAQLRSSEFCELGSTLFASIDKIVAAEAMCSFGLDVASVDFIGIELSAYFRQLAELIARHRIRQFESYDAVPAPRRPRIVYSHFVGNYAFRSALEYAAWLKSAEAFLIGESFSIGGGDVETSVLGKRSTHFDFSTFVADLSAAGFRLSPYHFRRVDLRGIPAIQVYLMACKNAVTTPMHVVDGGGMDPSVVTPVTSLAAIRERFLAAAGQQVEKPGGTGFRRKS